MEESSRPSKRPRSIADIGSIASQGGLKHDEEFWLEDGNIVLVARSIAFRVYRGLLASQSPVFAGMLAASSSTPEESHEGCPLVHLSDSPEDLRHFLRVLLPKSGRFFDSTDHRSKFTFDQVYAIVRLSHKYQVDDTYQQAMSHLVAYYTQEPESWLLPTGPDPWASSPLAIGAVNLARLTDTPSLLPRAMFHCAALGSSLLDGWEREDGTVEHPSGEDLKRCIDGRCALIDRGYSMVRAIFDPDLRPDSCTNIGASGCRDSLARMFSDAVMAQSECSVAVSFIFVSWDVAIDRYVMEWDVCHTCSQSLLKKDVRERQELWRSLPQLFNINS